MKTQELVPIYFPEDHLEADAIRQALTDEDIPCHIERENQAALAGSSFMSNTGRWRMRLLVKASDANRARYLIENTQWPTFGLPGED